MKGSIKHNILNGHKHRTGYKFKASSNLKGSKNFDKYESTVIHTHERSPHNYTSSECSESNTMQYHYKNLNSNDDTDEVN